MNAAEHDHQRPPICVLGLGLIGGSLIRAATAAGRNAWGYNRSAEGADAARAAGYDATADLDLALRRARNAQALIVLAVPVPALAPLLNRIAELAPECPLTDVTSVKSAVLQMVSEHGLAQRFVGGHPMAGTTESGWSAGNAELFRDATWVVSVDDDVDPHVFAQVTQLALDCGSVVVPARSDEHDAAAAAISHLPHLLAEALAVTADGVPLAYSLAAGSFRDGTRVAATDPSLVRAMCESNPHGVLPALEEAMALLAATWNTLNAENSVELLAEAGYAARQRYEAQERFDISGISRHDTDWREQLADAGRAGGVLRRVP
ncbi:prephenate dehydrogenase [Mycobacteroides abscessus 5S-0422]|uniref:NAD binding domain of 6-phosphogluconate dehydrogenase family protein n=1 Tax=Mycobacteroides abscessus subsp. bolletii 1513 TaxID=1299321 RepID=X8DYS1_9MYCO|nr:prephenate dehydrogenase [Mycobacteroides abscessus]EUA73549.1 NAD binding domain of 6-phosphogluconate dehydrogenase family protein [Mycobacteroides abscessus subsp. bolletii 1513]AMU73532.1 prephenate dehydrogenase [Mycobacteroides abscessus]ANO22473.1 prephenate dehydrogenase [Mycobacteroides abscessus]EIU06831.1 prephenate dehydrogenase [Mycobacteroides abscessus 5S-0421]EIU10090.1 prephenate dehydrogenase [Mycobacteroides abscessus 5S-0304]